MVFIWQKILKNALKVKLTAPLKKISGSRSSCLFLQLDNKISGRLYKTDVLLFYRWHLNSAVNI